MEVTHFPSGVIHPRGTLLFPTHFYEYAAHLYRGKHLQAKYRAQGMMIIRSKNRDYVRAQYDGPDDAA